MHSETLSWRTASRQRRHLAAMRLTPLPCGCRDPHYHHCEPRDPLPVDLDHVRDDALLRLKLGQTSPQFDWDRADVRALYHRGRPGDRFAANVIAHFSGWLTPADDGDQLAA